ncbi:MAG TPA: beta-L-arabinofuranosidase domain-containing protein [Phycisphaerae bacterium]|nr:beta-L-arabinofuranosidase domain-containing protein [Phycisphaerae bacterium]
MALANRKMQPLALAQVRIADGFWRPRLDVNRTASIPHIYALLKKTGRLDALRLAWKPGDENPPHIFWDSDTAKWLEAASYSLAACPDAALEKHADAVIDLLAKAQQPDGYLNVHFTVVEPDRRWTNLRDWHELYCAGHLIEAGVAHFEATGKRTLLDTVCRYADHIDSVFGPGKRTGYPGHEEIELALAKLYRVTDEERYLRLAEYFIDERGRRPHFFDEEAEARGEQPLRHRQGDRSLEYWQTHLPVREQSEVVGHAVRAMYLYSGMADLAAETGDEPLLAACRRLWQNVALRKLYITGGVGARHGGESFGRNHELPNESAYAETCAAIGLVFFAHRMFQTEADGACADVMERALYNGVLSGISLDGRKFFYVNPLASAGDHHRRPFFGCACCPPNLARLLASLGTYVYSASDDAFYVHLYVASQATAEVAGRKVAVTQETDYPWNGDVALVIGLDRSAKFSLRLRVPGWCRKFTVAVNGKRAAVRVTKGYATLRRVWKDGDTVTLAMAMPVERVAAHPAVAEDMGRVAITRGPIVYCLEQCDHRAPVRSIALPDMTRLTARFARRILGGCVVIEGSGLAPAPSGWKGNLYRRAADLGAPRPTKIRAIPYFLWDNRKAGAMTVWLPRA